MSRSFECFKCAQELRVYSKGKYTVTHDITWRSATFYFDSDLPEPNADGDYIDISPSDFSADEVYVEDFIIDISNKALRAKIEQAFDGEGFDVEQILESHGFGVPPMGQFNILASSPVASVEIT
jgi:hypothetical protein